MSSWYVRALIESWLNDPVMNVPYYSTINEEQNPQDDTWCTADFGDSFREILTFCDGNVREEGEIEVIYYGQPGIGYDALITDIEADVGELMKKRDPTGKMVIINH